MTEWKCTVCIPAATGQLISFIKDPKEFKLGIDISTTVKNSKRIPLTQGIGGPQIGWVESIHKDRKGNLVGSYVFTKDAMAGKVLENMVIWSHKKNLGTCIDASPSEILAATGGENALAE